MHVNDLIEGVMAQALLKRLLEDSGHPAPLRACKFRSLQSCLEQVDGLTPLHTRLLQRFPAFRIVDYTGLPTMACDIGYVGQAEFPGYSAFMAEIRGMVQDLHTQRLKTLHRPYPEWNAHLRVSVLPEELVEPVMPFRKTFGLFLEDLWEPVIPNGCVGIAGVFEIALPNALAVSTPDLSPMRGLSYSLDGYTLTVIGVHTKHCILGFKGHATLLVAVLVVFDTLDHLSAMQNIRIRHSIHSASLARY